MRSKHFEITVQGRGHFPIDMLRYSQCYPKGAQDVENIESKTGRAAGVRMVTLCLDHASVVAAHQCIVRFDSFGWSGEITGEQS